MDFTEDEILEYFAKYHNDHNFRFFNEIGDLTKQYPKLNKIDVNLLWGYTTNLFYRRMNGWLRWGENITKTKDIKNLFNNTLSKLPNFKEANVYRDRGIEIDSKGLSDFLNSYKKGSKPVWNDFTSAGSSKTASFANRPEVNILFDIKHLDAKDISDFADGIKFRGNPRSEVLIKSGSQFEVTKSPYLNKDKKWVIELVQIK